MACLKMEWIVKWRGLKFQYDYCTSLPHPHSHRITTLHGFIVIPMCLCLCLCHWEKYIKHVHMFLTPINFIFGKGLPCGSGIRYASTLKTNWPEMRLNLLSQKYLPNCKRKFKSVWSGLKSLYSSHTVDDTIECQKTICWQNILKLFWVTKFILGW